MSKIILLVSVIAVSLAAPSFAITRTWTGATSTNWSEPTNWSPAGVPDSSDSLVLGANANVMNNDLPPGTRVGPIAVQDFRTFTLTGNALTLTGPVTGMYFTAWNVDLKMETDVTLRGSDFHGAVDLNGHNLTLLALRTHPATSIDGTIVGTGTLTITGGDSIITRPSSFSGTVYVQNTCELDGSMPDANFVLLPEGDGGELRGNVTIGSLTGNGYISPRVPHGSPAGTLRTKSLEIAGAYVVDTAFTQVSTDRLEVTGTVTLSGDLDPRMGPLPPDWPLGHEVVIIDNDGTDPVIGTFRGVPEGALISADGFTLRVSYRSGDGNDVTLTAIAHGKTWVGACGRLWSAACNWAPATAPVAGEMLDFGAFLPSGYDPSNDLPPGFVVGGLTLNGYELYGNPITLMGDVTSGPLNGRVYMPVTLGAPVHIRAGGFSRIDMNGQIATFDGLTNIGELSGSGSIPPASLEVFSGTFSGTLSGTLVLGDLPNANVAGVTHLSGITDHIHLGDIVIDAGGTIDPGPITLPTSYVGTISGSSLSLAGTYDCDFHGYYLDSDGNHFDQIIVNGPVSLRGGLLNVVVRNAGQTMPSFTIIDNRGFAPVTGSFSGLPEGAPVQVGSSIFTITYRGGDGNDVVLLSEAPPTIALSQTSTQTVFGEPFTIRASVSGSGNAVTFADGLVSLGSFTPSRGIASVDVSDLGVGTHSITAAFSTVSATMTHTVQLGATALSVSSSIGTAQVAVVTMSVRPVAPAAGVPTGLVTINIDGGGLHTIPLTGGTATISTVVLSPGRHVINVFYAGDSNFKAVDASAEVVVAPLRARSVRH